MQRKTMDIPRIYVREVKHIINVLEVYRCRDRDESSLGSTSWLRLRQ